MAATTLDFEAPASEERLQAVVAKLRERNFTVEVVDRGDDVKPMVLGLLPDGALVHSGKSKTLEDAGVTQELMDTERWSR